jgi:hypothetical protein
MPKEDRLTRIVFGIMIGAVAAGVLIRLINPFLYDIRFGHDPEWHINYLIWTSKLRAWPYYVGPYYYVICVLHAAPALPFYLASAMDRIGWLSFGVGFANLDFFILYLIGVWRLGSAIEMERRQMFAWGAVCAVLPAIHRSLNMARPENLMLALAPWLVLWGLLWGREVGETGATLRSRKLWFLSIGGAVFITQKISGVSLISALWLVLLMYPVGTIQSRFKGLIVLTLTFAACTVLLGGAHRLNSGVWFFKHHAEKKAEYDHKAPLSFATNLDPVRVWRMPYRDNQRDSMPAILAVDFFGDYWRYGYSRYKRTTHTERKMWRAGLGLAATGAFLALTLVGSARVASSILAGGAAARSARMQLSFLLITVLAYALISLTAMFLQFNPNKGDVAKWEYMLWCLPFIALPASAALRGGL